MEQGRRPERQIATLYDFSVEVQHLVDSYLDDTVKYDVEQKQQLDEQLRTLCNTHPDLADRYTQGMMDDYIQSNL